MYGQLHIDGMFSNAYLIVYVRTVGWWWSTGQEAPWWVRQSAAREIDRLLVWFAVGSAWPLGRPPCQMCITYVNTHKHTTCIYLLNCTELARLTQQHITRNIQQRDTLTPALRSFSPHIQLRPLIRTYTTLPRCPKALSHLYTHIYIHQTIHARQPR